MLYSFARGSSTSLDRDYESESSSTASPEELWASAREGLLSTLERHKQLLDQFNAAIDPYLISSTQQARVDGQMELITVKKDVIAIGFKKNQGGSEETLKGLLDGFMNMHSSSSFVLLNEPEHKAFMDAFATESTTMPVNLGIEYHQAMKLCSLFAPGQMYSSIVASPFVITAIEKELTGEDKAIVLRHKLVTQQFEEKLKWLDERVAWYNSCVTGGAMIPHAITSLLRSFCAVARLVPTVIEVRHQLIDLLSARTHSFDVTEGQESGEKKNARLTCTENMV